jgi:hypothetical protein
MPPSSAARPREVACAARELVGGFERASGQLSLGLLTKLLRRRLGWLSAGEVAMARVQAAAEQAEPLKTPQIMWAEGPRASVKRDVHMCNGKSKLGKNEADTVQCICDAMRNHCAHFHC